MENTDLPEEWDDYLKEMFKQLFGKLPEEIQNTPEEELDTLKEKLLSFLDKYNNGDLSMIDNLPNYGDYSDDKSIFVQDLSDEDSKNRFNKFVEDYDMSLEIKFFKEDGSDMIKENWSNDDGSINVSILVSLFIILSLKELSFSIFFKLSNSVVLSILLSLF